VVAPKTLTLAGRDIIVLQSSITTIFKTKASQIFTLAERIQMGLGAKKPDLVQNRKREGLAI
jgi:hypothetical protein